MEQRIFPSIIARSQQELDTLLQKLEGVAETLHLDVVDGKFAPNHSLDFKFVLSPKYKFTYNAHVMAKAPEKWIKRNLWKVQLAIPQFKEVHDKKGYIRWMRRERKAVAFALSPETKAEELIPFAKDIDFVLVLTVHPGFYGAEFLEEELQKIRRIQKLNQGIKVIVDGGMDPATVPLAVKAGADYVVSGSFISKSEHPLNAMRELERAISRDTSKTSQKRNKPKR